MLCTSHFTVVAVLACQACQVMAATTSSCEAAPPITVPAASTVTYPSTMTWTGGSSLVPPALDSTSTASPESGPSSPGTVVTAGASAKLPKGLPYMLGTLVVGKLAWNA